MISPFSKAFRTRHFESSCQNRTWRNLTEDNGRCENPENAVFARLLGLFRHPNHAKINVANERCFFPSSNKILNEIIRTHHRTRPIFAIISPICQCKINPLFRRTTHKVMWDIKRNIPFKIDYCFILKYNISAIHKSEPFQY